MSPKSQKKRRHVQVPVSEGAHGRLWSYGVRTLAGLAKMTPRAVQKAMERGAFDPSDLRSVLRWLASREKQETPGKGWQPCPPGLSDATIAGLIAASPRLVRHARHRGQFDAQDGLSVAAWIYERRRWAKPVPSRQFERYALISVARPQGGHEAKVRRQQSVVARLRGLGLPAECRGHHVFVRPDYLPVVAAERLADALDAEGLASVSLRRRRRLALGPSVVIQRGGSRVRRES